MDDSDDAVLREEQKRIADLYAQAAIISDAELLDIMHRHSLDELALIMITFFNEATAFLHDAESAHAHMQALIAVIVRRLSEDDHVEFAACLEAALKGYSEGSHEVIDQLPDFDYVPQGDRIAVRITFPDADEG